MSAPVYQYSTEAQLLPRMIRLTDNLYAASFTLMKLVPAHHILRRAMDRGELAKGGLIVETTSGTFGLALAMEAALLGCRLVLVSDPVLDVRLQRQLSDLGTSFEICHEPSPTGGYQEARLRQLAEIRAAEPDSFCPEQYSNPGNPAAYRIVAEHFVRALGTVDCVVGPVGSGGSMCGTVRRLRDLGQDVHAVAVDTPASVLFGPPDGPRQLRGLGNSLMPANLDHGVFDEVHWCTAPLAHAATRELHREHALFHGPTSGAAFQVARWWARRNPDRRCVVMLPDEGYRYQDTVYNDAWLAENGGRPQTALAEPVRKTHPADPGSEWGWYPWRRRSLARVLRDADAEAAERGRESEGPGR